MGHFANQYWKSYSGLFTDWGTNSNDALSADFRPFDTAYANLYYFINTVALREGFIRLSYHLSIVPDTNTGENGGSMVILAKYTNPAGTVVTSTIFNDTWAAMSGGLDGDGFYVLSGAVHAYVKEGTPIQFYVGNEDVPILVWNKDGYINGNVTLEYDR